jgi:hypothetical protein
MCSGIALALVLPWLQAAAVQHRAGRGRGELPAAGQDEGQREHWCGMDLYGVGPGLTLNLVEAPGWLGWRVTCAASGRWPELAV